jgi:hypothetical protein
MSSPSSAYALVEDKRHKQFIYRFLIHAGFNRNKITVDISPSGQGSGKQWVCKRFAQQVETCRKRNAKTSTCMFTMIDADQLAVAKCMSDLDAALVAANQSKLDPARDPIARLIPKWSIETWILFLSSNGTANPPLSEDTPYKDSKTDGQWSELIPQAGKTLFAWTRSVASRPANLLDSLQRGLDEIPRALPVGR